MKKNCRQKYATRHANSSVSTHSVLRKTIVVISKHCKRIQGRSAGVRALASAMHEDPDTIENVYEPYLLRLGFIERSAQAAVLPLQVATT